MCEITGYSTDDHCSIQGRNRFTDSEAVLETTLRSTQWGTVTLTGA